MRASFYDSAFRIFPFILHFSCSSDRCQMLILSGDERALGTRLHPSATHNGRKKMEDLERYGDNLLFKTIVGIFRHWSIRRLVLRWEFSTGRRIEPSSIGHEWALGTRLHPSASSSHTTAERRWKIWSGTATICCLIQDHLDRLNNQVRKYRLPYQHYNWPCLIDCVIALNQVELACALILNCLI